MTSAPLGFVIVSCPANGCHWPLVLQAEVNQRLEKSHETFHCIWGHPMSYVKLPPPPPKPTPPSPEMERLRREAAEKEAHDRAQGYMEQPWSQAQRYRGICPKCGQRQPRGSAKRKSAQLWVRKLHQCKGAGA